MKKNFSCKSIVAVVCMAGLLAVSCYKFVSVTLSSHEIGQNESVTLSATLKSVNASSGSGYYWLLGARVPADWSAAGDASFTLQFTDPVLGAPLTVTPKTSKCAGYEKLLEFCFPKDGYKWICFQTSYDQSAYFNSEDDFASAAVTFNAGNAVGDFRLDVISGIIKEHPSTLLKGRVLNLEAAFAGNGADGKIRTIDGLLSAGTISQSEIDERTKALEGVEVTPGLAPWPRIDNLTPDLNLNVVVKDNAGIDGVADATVAAPVEWFTLQGVRIEHPVAGNVYIRRQGAETTKVLVK